MRKGILSTLLLMLVIGWSGCSSSDGGSTTAPTPTPVPPVQTLPASADVDVEILGAGAGTSGQGNAVAFLFEITERGGLGCNINFIRVDVFRATGEFEERQEIGAGEIIRQTGTHRLEANETRELTVLIGFRATVKSGRTLTVTIGMTDDRSNDQDWSETLIFN